jgi:type I restriction-modification system DNA methylase subunit
VAYAEAKDGCAVGDAWWKDAIAQGKTKAPKLGLPYFIVTNGHTSIFYDATNGEELCLNGNPIREFQTIDILRLIKNRLSKSPGIGNILTNVDSLSVISEAVFNKKLWELAKVYRNINFGSPAEKIDFTVGFVSLEYFEEGERLKGRKDSSKIYWSDCAESKPEKLKANLLTYIRRLQRESTFSEFSDLMEKVRAAIDGTRGRRPIVSDSEVEEIYQIIDSMKPLHGTGFDLFGAVYEMFASAKEKREFGEFFTRRHYAHIFAKLLLRDEQYFSTGRKFTILDPACGTGGFLTEAFKVLSNTYEKNGTLGPDARRFLSDECFWGVDARSLNISRTKLNMFLVGDGHTHMHADNSLKPIVPSPWADLRWDYVITNPPVGAGTIRAETDSVNSSRTEVAFLYRVIHLLRDGGKACVLLPDGVLENPAFAELRRDFLEKCVVEAVVSLPLFAFAPYTNEKMYAVFFKRKAREVTQIQKTSIWMYIIDNDGLANSDKRFPTKLRNNRNGWLHDEISGWVSTEGEEMVGKLEEAWMRYDDASSGGTEWMDERGLLVKMRKGGFVKMPEIRGDDERYNLLPERHLRRPEPKWTTPQEFASLVAAVEKEVHSLGSLVH